MTDRDRRVVVKFTEKATPYQAGETAGFAPGHAKYLVEQLKVAVYVRSPKREPAKESKP